MSDLNWEKVETIVDEVLGQPQKNWEELVEKRCGDSPEIKFEVTELLQSIFDSEGWLEDAGSYKANLIDPSLDEFSISSQIGNKFGSYRAKEIIAQGGMGTVYLAEREDGEFEHTVAIKVIKVGMNTPENIRLFNRERSILAGLNHPGIAKLLDGDVLESGAPYLIMEYVDGTPIDEYCDKNKLDITERIDLFKQVLRAVRHAHENLIIHRDLKPANILITDQGQVKILDFGIAKLLDPEDSSVDTNTTQARILTPKYAAPEQVRQEPVTTATDMYSLGIILYQLLVGRPPYDLEDKSAYEVEHTILNNDPVLPDKRLAQNSTSEKLAAKRSSSLRTLLKELKGDLNAILLKAIEKDPEKRYRTSDSLLDEFEKHFSGLPVSARQRTVRYRFNKFTQRNKTPLAVAVTFLLLISSFTFYHTNQITKERNQAQLEAEKAEQVTEFLVNLFGRSNPYIEEMDGGTDVTVGSILKSGTERIDEELPDQPAVRAELKTVLGEVYDALNEYDQAEKLLTEAVHIHRSSNQSGSREMAESIKILAFLYQEQGNIDEAEKLLEESISYYEKSEVGLKDHDAIAAIARLGNLNWYNKGDYEKADSLLNRALELRKSIHNSDHVHLATNYNDLATLNHAKGDYEIAEQYYRKSIDIYKKLFDEHSNLAIIMANFSALLKERGNYSEAEDFQRESLNMHKRLTGEENLDIALGTGNLGHILLEQNQLHKADSLLNYSLNQLREIFDSSHTYISRTKLNIGKLHLKQQNYTKAEETLLETYKEYEQVFPEGHPRKSDPLVALGSLYLAQNLPREAEPYFSQALQIRENGYGKNSWRTAQSMSFLGMSFFQLKKFEEAEPLLIQSYEILDKKRAKDDKYRIQTLEYVIQLYDNWGKPEKKEKYEQQLIS